MKKFVLFIVGAMLLLNARAQVGSLDQSFGNNGIRIFSPVANLTANVLKVLPAPGNQQYVLSYMANSQYPQVVIAKYLSDGTLDPSYGNGGYSAGIYMQFADAALQGDGRLVVAGSTVYNFYTDIHDDLLVARFTAAGTLDPSFNQNGVATRTYSGFSYEFTRTVTVNDQYIAVDGYSVSLVGRFAFFHVDVLDMNGNFTGSMLTSDIVTDLQRFNASNYNNSVALQGNKVVVASIEPDLTGAGNFFSLYRFLADGSPDNSFGQQGLTTLGNNIIKGEAIAGIQGDKILVTTFASDPVTNRFGFALARYNNDGTADNSFSNDGWQFAYFPQSIGASPATILTSGDTIYVGGRSYNLSTNRIDFTLARFTNNGDLDTHFDTDGMQTTGDADQSFILENLTIEANRLLVTGYANSAATGSGSGVVARYLLEDNASIACHADTLVSTSPGKCEAIVNGIDPVGAPGNVAIQYTLSGATTGSGQGSASGLRFNKGITTVKYNAVANPANSCSFTVTVTDTEAPVISAITTNPTYLWPVNHKMVDVQVNYTATDNCGPVTTILSVSSNEPEGKTGKDGVKGDWQIVNANLVKLRAERSGKSKAGRVYTINVTVTDAAGNTTTSQVTVVVPHNGRSHADISGQPYRKDTEETTAPQLQVKVLPNPSTTYFTLVTGSNNSKEKISLRVINQLGAVVETRNNIAPNGNLQLGHNYRDGIYIVELIQGQQRAQVKLVKLK